jgi:hypothetical protein
VGRTVGRRLVAKGHSVLLTFSHDRAKLEATAAAIGAVACQPGELGRLAEVLVLTTPWGATREALQAVGDLSGKLIWDCTNPLKADMSGLVIGTDRSAGEQVAEWAGAGAQVVKAIPPFAELMAREGSLVLADGRAPGVFVCGDHAGARQKIVALVSDIGADPVDAGPLRYARFTEPAAMLLVQLAYGQAMGSSLGLSLLRST